MDKDTSSAGSSVVMSDDGNAVTKQHTLECDCDKDRECSGNCGEEKGDSQGGCCCGSGGCCSA